MNPLLALFMATSFQFELPPDLLSSICFVESKHNPDAIHYNDGGSDSLGICQIKLSTAQWLGYTGDEETLLDPRVNIYWAAKFLARNIKRYQGNIPKAIIAYNRGSAGHLVETEYSNKVLSVWANRVQKERFYVKIVDQRQN